MILNILLMIVSVALIIVCLLQSGKSDGIVNALRGADLVLSRMTVGLAVAFFVLAILIRMG